MGHTTGQSDESPQAVEIPIPADGSGCVSASVSASASVPAAMRVHLRLLREDGTVWSDDGWPGATREVSRGGLSLTATCDNREEVAAVLGQAEGSRVVVEIMLNASRTVKTVGWVEWVRLEDNGFSLGLSIKDEMVAATVLRAARIVHSQPMILRALLFGFAIFILFLVGASLWLSA